jgi:hypothetical protein
MDESTRLIGVTLAAIALGMAVPVFVQLFVTLRDLQRAVKRLEQQVEPALRDLSTVLAQLREAPSLGQSASSLASLVVPAAVAAVRAFRAASSAPSSPTDGSAHHSKEEAS